MARRGLLARARDALLVGLIACVASPLLVGLLGLLAPSLLVPPVPTHAPAPGAQLRRASDPPWLLGPPLPSRQVAPAWALLQLVGERLRVHAALADCVQAGPLHWHPPPLGGGGRLRDVRADAHELSLQRRLDHGPDAVESARAVVAVERALGVPEVELRAALLGTDELDARVEGWALGEAPQGAGLALAGLGPWPPGGHERDPLRRSWDLRAFEAAVRERELLLLERLRAAGRPIDAAGWRAHLQSSDPHAWGHAWRTRLLDLGEDPDWRLGTVRRDVERPLATWPPLAEAAPFAPFPAPGEVDGPTPTERALAALR